MFYSFGIFWSILVTPHKSFGKYMIPPDFPRAHLENYHPKKPSPLACTPDKLKADTNEPVGICLYLVDSDLLVLQRRFFLLPPAYKTKKILQITETYIAKFTEKKSGVCQSAANSRFGSCFKFNA
jgi:hypothetical protein